MLNKTFFKSIFERMQTNFTIPCELIVTIDVISHSNKPVILILADTVIENESAPSGQSDLRTEQRCDVNLNIAQEYVVVRPSQAELKYKAQQFIC